MIVSRLLVFTTITACVIYVTALGVGCCVPGMAITVVLPALPERYPDVAWELSWWDGRAVRTMLTDTADAGVEHRVRLRLGRYGTQLPVVAARGRTGPEGRIPLAPYGGWIRGDTGDVFLDRHGGELSMVLLGIARNGIDPAVFNVGRLDSLVRARLPDHPRRLDHERLKRALAENGMRSYHVAELHAPLYQVRLPREYDAGDFYFERWISDDPDEEAYQPVHAGAWELFSVPVIAGEVRRLWRVSPTGVGHQVLVIQRTPDGNAYHHFSTIAPVPQS